VPIGLNNSGFDTFIHELAPDVVVFDRFMMKNSSAGAWKTLSRRAARA
jgi:hypothetical protein